MINYLLRPDHFEWLQDMAEIHNLGFTNKTLKETVDHVLRYHRDEIEAAFRQLAIAAVRNRLALERASWRPVHNCRLPDSIAREVVDMAAAYNVDFLDALHIILGEAVDQIDADETLEEMIFEAPRTNTCTSSLIRDFTLQGLTRAR